jgi:hypothetical protein
MSDKPLLGRVLGSKYDEDGFLCVQVEVFGTKSVGWFELSNSHGMQARPLDPDEKGACQAYYWYEGSRGYATLANDPRSQSAVPQLGKGEAFLHHPLGAGFVRMKADGAIALFTTDDGTTTGRTIFLNLSARGLDFVFPHGKLTFDDTGFHVLHSSGARIDLGSVGGLPSPLDQLSSYVHIGAAIARVEGAAVSLGARAGAAQPVALATQTALGLGAMNSVLAAMLVPGAFIAASPGSPCTIGPGLLAAIESAQATIGVAITALPSVSTTST